MAATPRVGRRLAGHTASPVPIGDSRWHATPSSRSQSTTRDHARTPAQWYCLLAGLSLLLAGVLGFISDSSFDTGSNVQGDLFLGFEVNAIHNLVHLLSGLVLLAASPKRASAKAVALGFGLVYGLVAVIGLIDGSDVLGLIPVNSADNVLHIALAALGILTGLMSRGDDRHAETTTGRV